MSIVIKAPSFPEHTQTAQVGRWFKELNQVVARNEILVELYVHNQIIPIFSPQAGLLERIFTEEGQTITPGKILARLKAEVPNLLWDPEQNMLILDTYRAEGVTTSMEYELRQLLRQGESRFGKGFGSGLALPQMRQPEAELGMGMSRGMAQGFPWKRHPKLNTSQFAGDFKDPRVNTVPSNPEARQAPQNAPTLGLNQRAAPSAPTPRPTGG